MDPTRPSSFTNDSDLTDIQLPYINHSLSSSVAKMHATCHHAGVSLNVIVSCITLHALDFRHWYDIRNSACYIACIWFIVWTEATVQLYNSFGAHSDSPNKELTSSSSYRQIFWLIAQAASWLEIMSSTLFFFPTGCDEAIGQGLSYLCTWLITWGKSGRGYTI